MKSSPALTAFLTALSLRLVLSPIGCQAQQQLRSSGPYHDHNDPSAEDRPRQLQDDAEEPVGNYEWSYDFVKRAAVGFNLTLIVKDDYLMDGEKVERYDTEVFQSFQVFEDLLDDRTLVVKDDDVCYMAVRGQERHILFDIWQTLSPFVKKDAFGSGCDVRRSFYNAYNARYADKMHDAIDECVASCDGGENCPLVLNGHSTGAAAVTIAALDPRIKKHNPTIHAMGPLRGIISMDCQDETLLNIYRIVAANAGLYDASADGSPKMGRQYGKFFMMDEMNDFYYISPDDNVLRSPDTYAIHGLEVYSNRMQALAARPESDFPLTLSQFSNGHWCGYNDECESGLCSSAKVCSWNEEAIVTHTEGAACANGNQCTSGTCKLGRCTLTNGKMGEGSPCEEHDDCDTEKCASGLCISQFFNGSFCNEDWECASQSCSGPMSFIALMMRRCADPE